MFSEFVPGRVSLVREKAPTVVGPEILQECDTPNVKIRGQDLNFFFRVMLRLFL